MDTFFWSEDVRLREVQLYCNEIQEIYSICFAVRRLNAVLEEYQKKYLPVKEPDVKVKNTVNKYIYSRTPVTRTLKGDEKRFELSGVRVIEGKII